MDARPMYRHVLSRAAIGAFLDPGMVLGFATTTGADEAIRKSRAVRSRHRTIQAAKTRKPRVAARLPPTRHDPTSAWDAPGP
jgi:hypothetical protein